ncbi:MAG: helix-turn-helix domain-containing protein [Chloroflexi bacterium]|nr:helix-turn-helix domain-containing protein [Chloroflexota bacterium]
MSNVSVNLRYLLWKKNPDRREWLGQLTVWADCDVRRAEELLRGDRPRKEEIARIAKGAGVSVTDLTTKDLLLTKGDVDILRENLRTLINGLRRGEKGAFAASLGIHATTVSAWLSGKQRPEKSNVAAVSRYFKLPSGTDLEEEALFLLPVPVAATQRKRWLKDRIEELEAADLQDIFPALAKLLGMR